MFIIRKCADCTSVLLEIDELAQRLVCIDGHVEHISHEEMIDTISTWTEEEYDEYDGERIFF